MYRFRNSVVVWLIGSASVAAANPVFVNVTTDAGISHTQGGNYINDHRRNTGGAAIGDYDGDGWEDLFVTRSDNTDILYRNKGDGTFEDVSVAAGFSINAATNGAAWGDIDHDGDLDLYVTGFQISTSSDPKRHYLYINNGDGTFSEQAEARGASISTAEFHYGMSATFGDYDRDGWLDIHVSEWLGNNNEDNHTISHQRLLRNRGAAQPGYFDDVTTAAGVATELTKTNGFSNALVDIDTDGWPDLLITGDYSESQMFWNDGDGTFTDATNNSGCCVDGTGMGTAFADFDLDGDLDWYVSEINVGSLYYYSGNRKIAEISNYSGVEPGGKFWGWGTAALDYDNDGDPDLALTTGWFSSALYNTDRMYFWQNGGNGVMTEMATAVGLTDTRRGQGLHVFDYDRDGDVDIFVVNNGAAPVLYRNDGGNDNDWLRVRLVGSGGNTSGLGARMVLQKSTNDPGQLRYMGINSHYLGHSEYVAHFGLGPMPKGHTVDSLTITWPDGTVQTVNDIPPNIELKIVQGVAPQFPTFADVTTLAGVDYVQGSGTFGVLGMTGGAAVADYDKDGFSDLLVTRSNSTDILFRNLGNGTFEDVSAAAGLTDSLASNGLAWGDIDNDGDLDLYVTSVNTTRFRLYVNNGSGVFTEDAVARGADITTSNTHQGFSVAFGDYDRDGWLDIHTTEWIHPTGSNASHSRLLLNRGAAQPGYFDDVTSSAGVSLTPSDNLGFASSFVDFDMDGWLDLLLVSDFGTSKLFWNDQDGTFTNGTSAANVGTDQNGMGTSIGDIDGDGDLDWFITSIFNSSTGKNGNRLFSYTGSRTFTDVTDSAGVRNGYWGWGSAMFDYDNDGDLDITHTNGFRDSNNTFAEDPMRFWENNGSGSMTEKSDAAGLTDTGLGLGLHTFDYDTDGDLDVFVVHSAGRPTLYRNSGGNSSGWLRLNLIPSSGMLPAVGAVATLYKTNGASPQVRTAGTASAFLGHGEHTIHFGLGSVTPGQLLHSVEIEWPSGALQTLNNVPTNIEFSVSEGVSPKVIRLRSPIGREIAATGAPLSIEWVSFGSVGNNVKISVLNDGVPTVLEATTPNDGQYTWNVPAGQAPGSKYRIEVRSAGSSTIKAVSPDEFTIKDTTLPGILSVISPDGDKPKAGDQTERWAIGSTYPLRWYSLGNTGPTVSLRVFSGTQNQTIVSATRNDGQFNWTIPNLPVADDYKVEIVSDTYSGQIDESNQVFSIIAANSTDTDGDGLTDVSELAFGSNPNVADTDFDGISDGDEVLIYGTSPTLSDTDGDGFSDPEEIAAGTDPTLASDFPEVAKWVKWDYVGTSDGTFKKPYKTIGTAYNAAPVGGVIRVYSGTYTESGIIKLDQSSKIVAIGEMVTLQTVP